MLNVLRERVVTVSFIIECFMIFGAITPSRFMGSGFQIAGKRAKWHQVCQSLQNILDKSGKIKPPALDTIVRAEKDFLANPPNSKKPNAARGSWLFEMLCHFFPDSYH